MTSVVHRFGFVRALVLGQFAAVSMLGCGADGGDGGQGASSNFEGKYFWQMAGKAPGVGMTIELLPEGAAVGIRPDGRRQQGSYYVGAEEKVIVSLQGDGASLKYTPETDGNLSTTFNGEKATFVKQ